MLTRLFDKMDALCDELGIFCIETIGDAYLCAANVLQPQPDHAVRMARYVNVPFLSQSLSHCPSLHPASLPLSFSPPSYSNDPRFVCASPLASSTQSFCTPAGGHITSTYHRRNLSWIGSCRCTLLCLVGIKTN
jgi:hypothetical protein